MTTNTYSRLILTSCALAALGTPCAAQEPSSGFYVAPLVRGLQLDEERNVSDSAAFGFAAGFEANRRWNFELDLFRGRFDGATGDDLTIDSAGVNALRVFRRSARVAPYLLFGLGAQRKDIELSGSSTDGYADAGAGLLTTLRKSADDGRALFLRLDARARYDDGGDRLDYLFGLGLQYSFGSGPRPAPPTELPVAPPPPPMDRDGDGVPDDKDRCAGTASGKPVDANGCEPDSDGDGVPDSRPDTCQGTPPHTRVDAGGCTLGKEIKLPRVSFEYDSDRLEPRAFATLNEAIATLRMNADLSIEVAGHTDARGPDAYNLELSRRRAETVRRYLLDHGVTNMLTARGYGEREPIADNGTEAGRAENRRVVLKVLSP